MLIHKNPKPDQKPNVLILLTDQQRHNAVGYVNPRVYTPNIDRLCGQSVNCPQTIVQSPQCQPSRASLLTSKYPNTLKMWWNDISLDRKERTLGNLLRHEGGYETGYFGKMHIDGTGSHTDRANHFGFSKSFLYEDWASFNNRTLDSPKKRDNPVYAEFHKAMEKEPWIGKFSSRELHHEDVITTSAINFIKSLDGSQPYLCVVSYNGPHPPYAAPPPFSTMYDPASFDVPDKMGRTYNGTLMTPDLWRDLKSQYYGCISWIDDNIGRLLDFVDDNTIIIFTSDHGDILGDHGLFSKGIYAFEGNVRVPLLMKFPGHTATTYSHTVQSLDIVPTILSAVGVKRERLMQGKDLIGSLWSNNKVNNMAFSCIGPNERLRMVRTPEFKYWWFNGAETLFDLRKDPGEHKNISSTHKDALSMMRLYLIEAMVKSEEAMLA